MALWRVKWAARQFIAANEYARHAAILESPRLFYFAMVLKLIPGLVRRPIRFALREGGVLAVTDFMTLFVYKEIFADRCYDLALASSAPAILDVGANTGLFAIRMKQLYPNATILCFEPYPANFAELERNLRQNSFAGVTPIMKGIGAQTQRAKLYLHPRNMGGHSLFPRIAGGDHSVDVDLLDLRSAIALLGGHCDLLKLDCEGCEYASLKSLSPADARCIARVVIEPTGGLYAIKDLEAHMARLGYSSNRRAGLIFFEQQGNQTDLGLAETPAAGACGVPIGD